MDLKTWDALLVYSYVPTDIPYSSDILYYNLKGFKVKYPFLKFSNIGISVMKKEIPYIKIGNGNRKVLYVGSTHANEWITTPLLMKFIENLSKSYASNTDIYGVSAKHIFNVASIYIVPMLNPDGVDLVNNNIDTKSISYINALNITNNFPIIPFPDGWKANISGIDLNLQFPAKWEDAKNIKYSQGYTMPSPRDFVGNYPLEAPEAIAIYDFCFENNFNLMLTYHTQGEVIYWKFSDYSPPKSEEIGALFSKLSGYTLADTPYSSSFAGFKDWFIQNYNLPAYTIEVGVGINPIPIYQFDKIYNDNIGILVNAAVLNE